MFQLPDQPRPIISVKDNESHGFVAWKLQGAAEREGKTFRRAVAFIGLLHDAIGGAGQRNIRGAEKKTDGNARQRTERGISRQVLGKQVADTDYSGIGYFHNLNNSDRFSTPLTKVRKRLCFSKRFLDFFSAFGLVIHAALPLVDFGDGVPIGLGALNAVRLHEREDSIILARKGILKGVQLLPQLHLKAVADSVCQFLTTILPEVVVIERVSALEVWDDQRDVRVLGVGSVLRTLAEEHLQDTTFLRAARDGDGVKRLERVPGRDVFIPILYLAALMGVPLGEIGRQNQI